MATRKNLRRRNNFRIKGKSARGGTKKSTQAHKITPHVDRLTPNNTKRSTQARERTDRALSRPFIRELNALDKKRALQIAALKKQEKKEREKNEQEDAAVMKRNSDYNEKDIYKLIIKRLNNLKSINYDYFKKLEHGIESEGDEKEDTFNTIQKMIAELDTINNDENRKEISQSRYHSENENDQRVFELLRFTYIKYIMNSSQKIEEMQKNEDMQKNEEMKKIEEMEKNKEMQKIEEMQKKLIILYNLFDKRIEEPILDEEWETRYQPNYVNSSFL
jgi:hypothetical protein